MAQGARDRTGEAGRDFRGNDSEYPSYFDPFHSQFRPNPANANGGGGGGGLPLGPSTPESMAATQTAANGVPPGIAASGGGLAGMPLLQQAIAMLAGSGLGFLSRFFGGGGGGANGGIPPELSALLGEAVKRTQYHTPLFQATTNQAFQGLPTYARDGLSLGKFPGK